MAGEQKRGMNEREIGVIPVTETEGKRGRERGIRTETERESGIRTEKKRKKETEMD